MIPRLFLNIADKKDKDGVQKKQWDGSFALFPALTSYNIIYHTFTNCNNFLKTEKASIHHRLKPCLSSHPQNCGRVFTCWRRRELPFVLLTKHFRTASLCSARQVQFSNSSHKKSPALRSFFFLAEKVGFEPTCRFRQTDFESAPL